MDNIEGKLQLKIGAEVILLIGGSDDAQSMDDIDMDSITLGDIKITGMNLINSLGDDIDLGIDLDELTDETKALVNDILSGERA